MPRPDTSRSCICNTAGGGWVGDRLQQPQPTTVTPLLLLSLLLIVVVAVGLISVYAKG